ncbi:Ion transport protein-domain-containing protein [Phycomyces nitens]|nr:Ion transport protein-domain-containing protein [Phycomyces nitens]
MLFFKSDGMTRRLCKELSTSSFYQWSIMGFLCISTVLSIWTDEFYRQNEPKAAAIIEIVQDILLGIFWIDFLIQVISDSLIVLPEAYLRKGWNIIDLSTLLGQTGCSVFLAGEKRSKFLRVIRTVRSIRIMYYVSGMRVIFLDIVHVFPKLFDAVTLNLLVFIPFAIYGSYIFGGRFLRCNDESAPFMTECYGEFRSEDKDTRHITLPRVWHNPYDYSYDNFGKSLLHLFECASGEGWVSSLFSAMSVPAEKNEQPRFDWSSPSIWYSLYYICFMFLASLCSIQLFIGLFLEIFKQRSGISSLTLPQRQYRDLQRQLGLTKPLRKVEPPLEGSIRHFCYKLVVNKHGKFTKFMTAILTLNILIFASEHIHQPLWLTRLQNTLYILFFVLYFVEVIIKLIGFGYSKWASTKWNIYDISVLFLIFITTVAKSLVKDTTFLDIPYKLLCVGVAFRLAKRSESLDTLFQAIQKAFPSIIYVTTAFFIVVVCFAVVFQEVFASTRYGPYGTPHANFRSMRTAILTLFRMTTGENWDFLMRDFSVRWPGCVDEKDCGSTAAFTLFIVFYIICTYIFVNIFTVIVISNFSFTFDKHNQFTLITRSDLRNYKQAWAEYDPRATGYIKKEDVPGFLRKLKGTLSINIYKKEYSIQSLLQDSNDMDPDVGHLASIPLSESKLESSFAANNVLGERFYNFYKVNQTLATMDIQAVHENKRAYNLVYQEIKMVSNREGISFHHMLEILALRLVDINRSLTFDKLVYQTRRRERVLRMVANDKIKSLVSMFVLRRRYLKKLQEMQASQDIGIELFDGWNDSTDNLSQDSSKASLASSNPMMTFENQTRLPKIVIDTPSGQDTLNPIPSQLDVLLGQPTFRQPARLPTETSSQSTEHSSRDLVDKECLLSKTLGPFVKSKIDKNYLCTPKGGHRRTISLHCWPKLSVFPPENPKNSEMALIPDNVFEKYYSMDSTLESMTIEDARQLTHQIQNTAWSDMLAELDD